jgi:hypothetical protein
MKQVKKIIVLIKTKDVFFAHTIRPMPSKNKGTIKKYSDAISNSSEVLVVV